MSMSMAGRYCHVGEEVRGQERMRSLDESKFDRGAEPKVSRIEALTG